MDLKCIASLLLPLGALAADLIPFASLPSAALLSGLEPNRGQANADVLFLARHPHSFAFTANSIVYSAVSGDPLRLSLHLSNPAPTLRLTDPLPGRIHTFTGVAAVTNISRYAAAELLDVYPGIHLRYVVAPAGEIRTEFTMAPGVSPSSIVFWVSAIDISAVAGNRLVIRTTTTRGPTVDLVGLTASSGTAVFRRVSFNQFGFTVTGADPTRPLTLSFLLTRPTPYFTSERRITDSEGSIYLATSVADVPAKPTGTSVCGAGTPCADVAVSKFTPAGDLVFVTYLSGTNAETPVFLKLAPDGQLAVTGTTSSYDFPITASAAQRLYGGPSPIFGMSYFLGDLFAARIDAASGALLASTFLGGPERDTIGQSGLGPDGSLYIFPESPSPSSARMPTTATALLPECPSSPCVSGYAARLSANLDTLLYGTYLPAQISSASLHSDGSLYFAGSAEAGFPTTPGVLQPENAGGADAVVARLDPAGRQLLFATYLGTPRADVAHRIAVEADGSAWAAIRSSEPCCADDQHQLLRLDHTGSRLLVQLPIAATDLVVDNANNLHVTATGHFTVSPNAVVGGPCGPAFLRLSPSGSPLFTTYLPSGYSTRFAGVAPSGRPVFDGPSGPAELDENRSGGVLAGCVVDGAGFAHPGSVSPGGIVTLFGSQLGPREGVAFQLDANNRVPTSLVGTQVLFDGTPVPILYASWWQVNVIIPFNLNPFNLDFEMRANLQAVSGSRPGNVLNVRIGGGGISIFRTGLTQAAALNEDGSINSPANPARAGSRVVLFGTGGGDTWPPSTAGEINPLEPRLLKYPNNISVWITETIRPIVEYAGAAPGQVAGVNQFNLKLPDTLPAIPNLPAGTLPINFPGYSGRSAVTIAVR